METTCDSPSPRRGRSRTRPLSGWIVPLRALVRVLRKPAPASASGKLRIPMRDLQRLAETSPHLLADIGLTPPPPEAHSSPWDLPQGRDLVLRSPL